MEQLIKIIEESTDTELERANSIFPKFSSKHEGLAVLEEELYEAKKELIYAKSDFETLKEQVFEDIEPLEVSLGELEASLTLATAELMQSIAMVKKFRNYLEQK